MGSWWREQLARRPGWMNGLLFFCLFMALVYVPWDLLTKPLAQDEQAWFGFLLHGWAAKLTEPLHEAVYALGAYGFWRMRRWMWPWAALYAAYVGVSGAIWSLRELDGTAAVLSAVGSLVMLGAVAAALWRAREAFAKRGPSLRERYGEWALVTGASAGIGAEFARALAREGMSVVLSARREPRLRELAEELSRRYGVAARIVAADLARREEAERLAREVRDLDLGLLVNNAGFGYRGRFEKLDLERQVEMVELNCVAPLLLTGRLLPRLRERGRGAVIFTGSAAGRQPLPLHAVYAATKAFDAFLGEALWAELRGSGIDVLVLEPGATATEFQQVAGEVSHRGEPPERVVATALDALGRQPSVLCGWFNWLRANAGVRLLPRSWLVLLAGRVMERDTPPERA